MQMLVTLEGRTGFPSSNQVTVGGGEPSSGRRSSNGAPARTRISFGDFDWTPVVVNPDEAQPSSAPDRETGVIPISSHIIGSSAIFAGAIHRHNIYIFPFMLN